MMVLIFVESGVGNCLEQRSLGAKGCGHPPAPWWRYKERARRRAAGG